MHATTYHTDRHRIAAVRRFLEQTNADPGRRITVTFSGEEALLEGEADCFADKDAALSATLLLGEATVVTDRVRVCSQPADRGRTAHVPAERALAHQ